MCDCYSLHSHSQVRVNAAADSAPFLYAAEDSSSSLNLRFIMIDVTSSCPDIMPLLYRSKRCCRTDERSAVFQVDERECQGKDEQQSDTAKNPNAG